MNIPWESDEAGTAAAFLFSPGAVNFSPEPGTRTSKPPPVAWAESVGINRHGVVDERTIRGRASHPPRPRVMRRDLVTGWRSVDRGSASRAIELRKKQFPSGGVVAQCVAHTAKRAQGECLGGTAESPDPERAWTLHGREPRDPSRPSAGDGGPAGEGKSVIPASTVLGSRTGP